MFCFPRGNHTDIRVATEVFLHRPGFSSFSLCQSAPSKAGQCEKSRMSDMALFIDDKYCTVGFCRRNSSTFSHLLYQK